MTAPKKFSISHPYISGKEYNTWGVSLTPRAKIWLTGGRHLAVSHLSALSMKKKKDPRLPTYGKFLSSVVSQFWIIGKTTPQSLKQNLRERLY
jgi:hypothetical protein